MGGAPAGAPPPPNMLPRPPIPPPRRLPRPMPPLPIFDMMARIWLNCLSSWLISCNWTPEPFAIRWRRELLMISGSRRSFGVMELMMPSMRLKALSSISSIGSSDMPGMNFNSDMMPPILRIFEICERKSSKPKVFWRRRSSSFLASSASNCSAAFSTNETTSPMPRMREAMRSGWKASRSMGRSPTVTNLMGLPVT